MKLKRPLRGSESGADVRMVQRALNRWAAGKHVDIPVTSVYDRTTSDRVMAFQAEQKIKPASGDFGQRTLGELWRYFDAYGRMRYRLYRAPAAPNLGPIVAGGISVLDHQPTHQTDGLPDYIAFDDGWLIGKPVLAPENLVVTKQSSAQGGDAFYAEGASRLRYWVGHIHSAPPTGTKFKKGQTMTHIAVTSRPHVHLGIDAQALGVRLKWGKNGNGPEYSYGAPTIGEQLNEAL